MVRLVGTPWCHTCDLLRPFVWPIRTICSGSGNPVIIESRMPRGLVAGGSNLRTTAVLSRPLRVASTHVPPDNQRLTHPSVAVTLLGHTNSSLGAECSLEHPRSDCKLQVGLGHQSLREGGSDLFELDEIRVPGAMNHQWS